MRLMIYRRHFEMSCASSTSGRTDCANALSNRTNLTAYRIPARVVLILVLVVIVCCPHVKAQAAASCRWKTEAGTRIPIPPSEHPRLFLRATDAKNIPARLRHPALQPAIERLKSLARRSAQFQVEWDALQYVARPNRARGRSIIERALKLVTECKLPDRHDACRVTGRMMVTGAIAYDWCYDLLSPSEKQQFVDQLVRLARTLECGYPPVRQGSVTGHSSEAMIMRDMLSAGIAIYDEYPEMYNLAAGRFFREHRPARNWLYAGHAYHQGDSYGPYRYGWDTFPLFIFDRLGAGNVYNPEQRGVPYYYLYATRPDGQRLRGGDTFMHHTPRGEPWGEGIGTLLTASYYGDGVLLGQYLRQGGNRNNEVLFEILWRDTQLKPLPRDGLALSRYFGPPFGWMIARTGWGDDSVVAEMKINEYNFTNHQHLDAGAFQIYYKGALAIDSGLYSGSSGQYGSPHCCNYAWRTIAHNSLLIYDPNERLGRGDRYGNDGGQRLPNNRSEPRNLDVLLSRGYRTGRVLAHGFGPNANAPEFTLLQGDITDAYSDKVKQVRRSMVFLHLQDQRVPAALVVFDRIVSADPNYKKYWLLHTLEQPRRTATGVIVERTQHGESGRLCLDVLLPKPENRQLDLIGGPGREFWVFGTNYANEPANPDKGSYEIGKWRVQITPRQPAVTDLLLNVLQVTDREQPGHLPVRRLETDDRVGCVLQTDQCNWIVLLRRDVARSSQAVQVDVPARGHCRLLVTDLKPGVWQARHANESKIRELKVTNAMGAAWLDGPTGKWTLTKASQ